MEHKQQFKDRSIRIAILFIIASALLTACSDDPPKKYTVGVINSVPVLEGTIAGFKEGMTELGYTEGENITYLYSGPTLDMNKLDDMAQGLVEAEVDLILCITTPPTKAAHKATAGTDLPVVFVPVTDPVGAGIVDSLKHPGGNITGITFGIQEARRLEWLIKIAPKTKQIYVPYNSNDKSPVLSLKMMSGVAAKLGVGLITRETRNPEELMDAIKNIPTEADAVLYMPDSLVSTRLPDLIEAATKRKLPLSAPSIEVVKRSGALTAFGSDVTLTGKQAARLAHQIFQGVKPADLPVETAEFFLAINLKVAKAIGLNIPDEILRQAHIIIR